MNKNPPALAEVITAYTPASAGPTAAALRAVWMQGERKSVAGIKAEERARQETVGIALADLKRLGKTLAKTAARRPDDFIPLAQLLWEEYGREGRVVAALMLGPMTVRRPERLLPLLRELCRGCHTWEDADRLAMDAAEPIVRRDPEGWLPAIAAWLDDDNPWVRRAGVTVIGRLPMKHPAHTPRCLDLTEQLLNDQEEVVRKAVSFAIRLSARGDVAATRAFLARHVPPADAAATWVLCDAVRSMTKRTLPDLLPLLANYRQWAADPTLDARERRSVESALRTLEKIAA